MPFAPRRHTPIKLTCRCGVCSSKPRHQGGFTLLELTAYVAIISMIAAIVVPNIAATNLLGLELAEAEVADAFRFARDRTRLSGNSYGITVDPSSNLVRVFRLDDAVTPNVKVYDVYHPISKQLYKIQLDRAPYHRVAVNAYSGTPSSTCNDLGSFAFDRYGLVHCTNPTSSRFRDATVELGVDEHQATVAIDAMTGRVTIQ